MLLLASTYTAAKARISNCKALLACIILSEPEHHTPAMATTLGPAMLPKSIKGCNGMTVAMVPTVPATSSAVANWLTNLLYSAALEGVCVGGGGGGGKN
jgi:hypothetical protein